MKDADDLALNMNKMLNLDKAERRTMGANSRKKIEDKFDERIVIQKYLDAIYSIKIKRKVQFSIKKYLKEKLVAKQA
ncbi:MAG: hypothetical protein M3421_12925, partial [Bacteroidota bacterium]|nr:hypothetical protein [Bacteroidota bacterium]